MPSLGHELDDADHSSFICSAFQGERGALEIELQVKLSANNDMQEMLTDTCKWKHIGSFFRMVVDKKREKEREIKQ